MSKHMPMGLEEMEHLHNVEVLYAVENGSRVWGFADKKSDYDIRFVFKRPLRAYHEIDKNEDQLQEVTDGSADSFPNVDIVGFDVHKFFYLLTKSNPTVIEWLMSPKKYQEHKTFSTLADYMTKNVNLHALYMHYYSLAKDNYEKYCKADKVAAKKYLYVFRGIYNAVYISFKGEIPPVLFSETRSALQHLEVANPDLGFGANFALSHKGEEINFNPAVNKTIEAELKILRANSMNVLETPLTPKNKIFFNNALWFLLT